MDDLAFTTILNSTLSPPVPPSSASVKLYDDNNPLGYNDDSDRTALLQDQPHIMACFIEGTRPAPQVIWRLDGEEQTTGVTTTPSQNPDEPLFFDTNSTFSFTPTECASFNSKVIECETNISGASSNVVQKRVTIALQSKILIPIESVVISI